MMLLYPFILATVVSAGSKDWNIPTWNDYKSEHNKLFVSPEEEATSLNAYNESVACVEKHKKLYDEGKALFSVEINERADVEIENYSGYNPEGRIDAPHTLTWNTLIDNKADDIPDYVNWAQKGFIGPVHDQGKCGCCYIFAATQVVESQWKMHFNTDVLISNKDILDCSGSYGNKGCTGGLMTNSYQYMKERGITTSDHYPFSEEEGKCRADLVQRYNASVYTWVDISSGDEGLLKVAVAKGGPIAVAMASACRAFQLYKEGIFDCTGCKDVRQPNHAAVIYGYGTTKSGVPYWLVKNNWGEAWGEKGHFKIIRGKNCLNIAVLPSIVFLNEDTYKALAGGANDYYGEYNK